LADKREVRLELQTSLTSAFAEVDGGKVHQIVQNLVRNAIEAAPGNSAVQIDVDQSDERVAIAIEDHGPGIPEEIKRRMFEPFFSTKEAGTGLGMAIVHSLVAQHQGTLTVTTEPGQTRFVVELARRAK
jgi:signal transduction histidine kinase